MTRLKNIRQAEAHSHVEAYSAHSLYAPGSWLAKPVKTVLELIPRLRGGEAFRALDLGCGVGRNAIPVAKELGGRVDCVDILPFAIEKLLGNGRNYGVSGSIRGIVSGIEEFAIEKQTYDLILAVSALEHTDSEASFLRKLAQIRDGIREGGAVCLIVNSGVWERDKTTGRALPPQFEVNLPTAELMDLLESCFAGWRVEKRTVVHQKYDIPREMGLAELETDVLTWVAWREER